MRDMYLDHDGLVAFHNFLKEDLSKKAGSHTAIYVDAESGDDSNNGTSSSAPLKTIDEAFDRVSSCDSFSIQLAAGTYVVTDGLVSMVGKSFFINGAGKESTIIKGAFFLHQSRVAFERLTVDDTGVSHSRACVIYAVQTDFRSVGCSYVTDKSYCLMCRNGSHFVTQNSTLSGSSTFAVVVDFLSSVQFYALTDETGLGILNKNGCEVIVSTTEDCGDINITTQPHAITYYNGRCIGGANAMFSCIEKSDLGTYRVDKDITPVLKIEMGTDACEEVFVVDAKIGNTTRVPVCFKNAGGSIVFGFVDISCQYDDSTKAASINVSNMSSTTSDQYSLFISNVFGCPVE